MENKKYEIPHLDKVIGIPKEYKHEQEALEKELTRRFIELGGKKIKDFELEKTEKDKFLINFAGEAVDDYLKQYGREKKITIPLNNIHILKEGGVKEYTDGKVIRGAHSIEFQDIIVDRSKPDVEFSLTLFHELFHTKSFVGMQVTVGKTQKERKIKDYRAGFSVTSRDGKKIFFYDVNEAITGLMTKRFYEEYVKKNELFKEELKKIEENGIELDTSHEWELGKGNEFIDRLWELNKTKFKNRDEIVDIFIDAGINGRLVRVAKLIESTFGEGSFRKLGEQTAKTKS